MKNHSEFCCFGKKEFQDNLNKFINNNSNENINNINNINSKNEIRNKQNSHENHKSNNLGKNKVAKKDFNKFEEEEEDPTNNYLEFRKSTSLKMRMAQKNSHLFIEKKNSTSNISEILDDFENDNYIDQIFNELESSGYKNKIAKGKENINDNFNDNYNMNSTAGNSRSKEFLENKYSEEDVGKFNILNENVKISNFDDNIIYDKEIIEDKDNDNNSVFNILLSDEEKDILNNDKENDELLIGRKRRR